MNVAIWDLDNCLSADGWRLPLIRDPDVHPAQRFTEYHALCHHDAPRNLDVFQALSLEPVFITGRPEAVRTATRAWIRAWLGVEPHFLFMRADDDHRRSVQVKRDLVRQRLPRHLWNVMAAYDDHAGIVEMYRTELNIPAQRLFIQDRNEHE